MSAISIRRYVNRMAKGKYSQEINFLYNALNLMVIKHDVRIDDVCFVSKDSNQLKMKLMVNPLLNIETKLCVHE